MNKIWRVCYSNRPVNIHFVTKCWSAFYVLIKAIFSYGTGAVEIKSVRNWVGENKSCLLSRKNTICLIRDQDRSWQDETITKL